jgi:uncharacterized protein (UPF0212 family)
MAESYTEKFLKSNPDIKRVDIGEGRCPVCDKEGGKKFILYKVNHYKYGVDWMCPKCYDKRKVKKW